MRSYAFAENHKRQILIELHRVHPSDVRVESSGGKGHGAFAFTPLVFTPQQSCLQSCPHMRTSSWRPVRSAFAHSIRPSVNVATVVPEATRRASASAQGLPRASQRCGWQRTQTAAAPPPAAHPASSRSSVASSLRVRPAARALLRVIDILLLFSHFGLWMFAAVQFGAVATVTAAAKHPEGTMRVTAKFAA